MLLGLCLCREVRLWVTLHAEVGPSKCAALEDQCLGATPAEAPETQWLHQHLARGVFALRQCGRPSSWRQRLRAIGAATAWLRRSVTEEMPEDP